jgi:hypothetical protein
MHLTQARVQLWLEGEQRHMSLTVRFQETLRMPTATGEGFAEDGARLAPGPAVCWLRSAGRERGGSGQGGADALRHACRDENAQRGCEAVGAGTTTKTAMPRP